MIALLYNILQLILLIIFWPLIFAFVVFKPKYRKRIPARLGFPLPTRTVRKKGPTFWVHALSVGETTSAVPLVKGLRKHYPESRIVVSVSTESGEALAKTLLATTADEIFSSPLDILPVLSRFVLQIQPDVYILVETDFWPNILSVFRRKKIPTLLVNGRISEKSLADYKKFSFFFTPMFRCFSHLVMQSETDRLNILKLNIDQDKLHTLGNLKMDAHINIATDDMKFSKLLPENKRIIVAGSTHPGEEEVIFSAYSSLKTHYPDTYLVLAPRKPERAEEILALGAEQNLCGVRRSEKLSEFGDYFLLDTIGELADAYRHGAISFVGGTLVAEGGHNPIEPASMGIPVLFGPHMEDFAEVASNLIHSGGAVSVANHSELESTLRELMSDSTKREQMGLAAKACIDSQKGVIKQHIDLIQTVL
ncbi:3-deoxy-D-manno-octulosonic acid transferase [Desulfosediminicola flagellatus]|uniref:3-deoxy-D-manno-octulosonic acid transferase n=1 Tax=Desulfosediminicola flagellatus TaxID=2569541 RepID=UPI00142F1BC5|nr:3-deoxy-D-manno-octulosonic acid transferase [Desulfosediminicola flagellatus]